MRRLVATTPGTTKSRLRFVARTKMEIIDVKNMVGFGFALPEFGNARENDVAEDCADSIDIGMLSPNSKSHHLKDSLAQWLILNSRDVLEEERQPQAGRFASHGGQFIFNPPIRILQFENQFPSDSNFRRKKSISDFDSGAANVSRN